MTDKELQKLKRRELLQLLLEQAQESERLRGELAAAEERAREMDETFARLRQRLNDKDNQIEEQEETFARLRHRLDQKDARIRELEEAAEMNEAVREAQGSGEIQVAALSEVGSIAEAALQLNGIFEAAQKAADLYLQKVRERNPMPQESAPQSVVVDAVIENAPPREKTVIIAQPVRPVVDVEPKPEAAPAPRPEPVVPQTAYPQPAEPVRQGQPAQPAEDSGRRGFFQRRKQKDGKRKFVLSFGWEQD